MKAISSLEDPLSFLFLTDEHKIDGSRDSGVESTAEDKVPSVFLCCLLAFTVFLGLFTLFYAVSC